MSSDGRVSRGLFLFLTVAAAVGFTALGVWQLERRVWKLDLIHSVENRIHAAAEPVPGRASWPSINQADDAYRHIYVDGRFLHDRETLVQAVTENGPGFWVLTPLQTKDGETILVNRGFVSPERRSRSARAEGLSKGDVRVTGLLRISEPGGGFLRSNDPDADRWYSRDVAAIAGARHLPDAAPFFVDADATPNAGGWPVGGLTVVAFHNNHLVYAFTWFALALMAAGAALRILRGVWLQEEERVNSRSPGLVGRQFGKRPAAASRHSRC